MGLTNDLRSARRQLALQCCDIHCSDRPHPAVVGLGLRGVELPPMLRHLWCVERKRTPPSPKQQQNDASSTPPSRRAQENSCCKLALRLKSNLVVVVVVEVVVAALPEPAEASGARSSQAMRSVPRPAVRCSWRMEVKVTTTGVAETTTFRYTRAQAAAAAAALASSLPEESCLQPTKRSGVVYNSSLLPNSEYVGPGFKADIAASQVTPLATRLSALSAKVSICNVTSKSKDPGHCDGQINTLQAMPEA
mmetsp:Transcript_92916/g.261902  ORF Transcript_92916/g.261902 Transcript_92916/m.261902 type:complete len:250 (+) Transcript_92916:508-1257(+)